MKKFKIIFVLTVLVIFDVVYAVQDEHEKREKPFFLCNQLKKINPDAPYADYFSLEKSFLENGLSLCECTQYLIEKKHKKTFKLMKHEGDISDKQYNDLINLRQNFRVNSKSPTIPLILHFSPESKISMEIKEEICRYFSGYTISMRYDLDLNEFNSPAAADCTYEPAIKPFTGTYRKNGVKIPNKVVIKEYHLYIKDEFENYSLDTRYGTLSHEEQHFKNAHRFQQDVISALFFDSRQLDFNVKENKILQKFVRANEAEADRIPAACTHCMTACSFDKLFVEIAHKCAKDDVFHSSIDKRILWAKRLYKAKLAEEELKNNNPR